MRPAPLGLGASGSPQRGCECWRGCGDREGRLPPVAGVCHSLGSLWKLWHPGRRVCTSAVPRTPSCLPSSRLSSAQLAPEPLGTQLQLPTCPCWPGGGNGQGRGWPALSPQAGSWGGAAASSLLHAALPCASDIALCALHRAGTSLSRSPPGLGEDPVSAKRSLPQPPHLEHCTRTEPHGTVLALPASASPPCPQGCDPMPQGRTGHPLTPPAASISCLRGGKRNPPASRAPSLRTGALVTLQHPGVTHHVLPCPCTPACGCPPASIWGSALPALLADELTCSARLTVKPSVQPLFTRKLEDVDVVEGRTARFDCMVSGTPPPAVSWTHFGNPHAHGPPGAPDGTGLGMPRAVSLRRPAGTGRGEREDPAGQGAALPGHRARGQ